MKNLKILFALFLVALLYAGCKKEKDIVKGREPLTNSLTAMRIDGRDMEDSMNTFITQTNQTTPSFHDYEAGDALLVMEAALNYHTCFPDSDYDKVAADTLTWSLPLVKDSHTGEYMYSGTNMNYLWPVILDSTVNAGNRVKFASSNSFNIVADLEFTNFNPADTSYNQIVTLQVITWVGNVSIVPINWPCTYDSNTDYWHAWSTGGCGVNSGNTTSSAIKEIQKRLNPICIGLPDCSYYSNIFSAYLYPDSYSNGWPCDPDGEYMWDGSDPNECLSPAQMSCYTYGAHTMAEIAYTQTPFAYMVFRDMAGSWYTQALIVKYGDCHKYVQ